MRKARTGCAALVVVSAGAMATPHCCPAVQLHLGRQPHSAKKEGQRNGREAAAGDTVRTSRATLRPGKVALRNGTKKRVLLIGRRLKHKRGLSSPWTESTPPRWQSPRQSAVRGQKSGAQGQMEAAEREQTSSPELPRSAQKLASPSSPCDGPWPWFRGMSSALCTSCSY